MDKDERRSLASIGRALIRAVFKYMMPPPKYKRLSTPWILNRVPAFSEVLDIGGVGSGPLQDLTRELLNQGKSNLQAPWLGMSAFFVLAIMLSLLIFVGEAVRDAFDPRKTFK